MSLLSWLHDHDGHVALGQLLVWGGCLGFAARPLRQAWARLERNLGRTLLVIGVVAALISVLVFPLSRYDALGHEATYYECYLGARSPSSTAGWASYVTYPLMRWGYWAIGGIVGRDSGLLPLLMLNAVARGVGVIAFGWLCRELVRSPAAGIAGAGLLALHPMHAFWGAGTYPVSIPHAGVSVCLLLTVLAWRATDARLLAAAAATGGLVVALRVEWGLLAPCLLLLVVTLGPTWGRGIGVLRPRFWGPAVALGALYFVTTVLAAGGSMAEQGGYDGAAGYLQTLGRQIFFLEVFSPWQHPWMVALIALGLGLASHRRRLGPWGAAGLVLFAVVAHLGMSTFNDAAYRHALLPSLALLAAASTAADLAWRGERPGTRLLAALLLGGAVVTSVAGLLEGRERYYAEEELFFESVSGFRGTQLEAAEVEAGDCYLITDDERLWSMGLAGSHFNLMDPGEAVSHYRDYGGCVLWLYDRGQWRWDGISARVRARKMQYWFTWEEQGWVELEEGLVAVVYRMASPPWGIADDAPVPDSEFVRSREGE